jgi:hypothetical protein
MSQNAPLSPTPPPVATEPSSGGPPDRATSFQPVEGGNEVQSGSALLVEAYAVIWTLLMVWLVLMWRKQGVLAGRLDDLELAIDRAAAKRAREKAPAKKPEGEDSKKVPSEQAG